MAESPIQTITEVTGLPTEIWGDLPKFPRPCKIVHFESRYLSEVHDPSRWEIDYHDWIPIHSRTISDLKKLPSAHVLGQAVLARAVNGHTAMVSIAEAASALLEEAQLELLWILTQEIERQLRADATDGPQFYSHLYGDRELSAAEHLQKERERERNRERYKEGHREILHERLEAERKGQKERGSNRGDDIGSYTLQALTEEVGKVKEEHKALKAQLDGIREQNDEILRLVKGLYEKSSGLGKVLPSSAVEGHPEKHYDEFSFANRVMKKSGKWFLVIQNSAKKCLLDIDIRFLMDWLEIALGGTGFSPSSSLFSGCISLRDENKSLSVKATTSSASPETQIHNCWRKKILSGNILGLPRSKSGIPSGGAMDTPHSKKQGHTMPFNSVNDCLLLSAAALWSLFDNSLERVPSCGCTFRASSNDFIQCKGVLEGGQWLLWHTFSNVQPCTGEDCSTNQRVALTSDESGIRVFPTSPCVLGWAGKNRTQPNSPLWKILSVTSDLRKKSLAKYEVTQFQAQAQLSVPVIVTPRISGAITFSKRNYEIANTIDSESVIAMGKAAQLVVFIYDERRGLHLACDGADLIEILCLHCLRDMGGDTSTFPQFSHNNALLRLPTWYQSRFVSPMGICFTGDHLIREASKRISKLVEVTTNAAKKDSVLLYWLLEDILCGSGSAIRAPKSKIDVSWYGLALKKPPLILAIGELDDELLMLKGSCLQWQPSSTKEKKSFFDFSGFLGSHSAPGAIVGSKREMRRWLLQAQPFYAATLEVTGDKVMLSANSSEPTYKVVQSGHVKNDEDTIFASCQDCKQTSEGSTQRCLHYI